MKRRNPSAALVPVDEFTDSLLAGCLSRQLPDCLALHRQGADFYGVVYRGPEVPPQLAGFEQLDPTKLQGLGYSDAARQFIKAQTGTLPDRDAAKLRRLDATDRHADGRIKEDRT